MGSEKETSKIEKFDGTNFGYWKMQMEDYLYQKDLYLPLGEKPEDMKDVEWKLLDRKALGAIRLTLSKFVAFNIKNQNSTTDLMATLSSMYEQPSAANKVHLIKKLFNLRMSENQKFKDHLNEFNEITDQLNSVNIKFDDEIQALLILGQLPDSWKGTVISISGSCGKSKLKFSEVVDMVMTEEIRRQEEGVFNSGSALNVESRGRNRNRNRGNSRGRPNSRNGRSRSRNRKSKKEIDCWNCGKFGHYENQCREPKKDKENKTEANVVSGESDDALICSLESKTESWVLDSGASFHATSNRDLFENYVSGNLGKVYLGDDQPCDIVGKGAVQIKLNGSTWKLNDVRHVPSLRKNLISIGQLAKEGYISTFACDTWKVTKGSMIVARGTKSGSLYMTTDACGSIAVAESKEDPNLWHQRLGHMSSKGLKVMQSNGKLPGLRSADFDLCESCIFGKHKRISFKRVGRTPKDEKLELVHTDVWGPAPLQSIGGRLYFVTFIDDHSRKTWVYFMKHKSEVFEIFKRWKAMVENETGLKIKKLRSDNGGEYEDSEFKKFCYDSGIRLERTVPGTPQQNDIAERMNRTLSERGRSMRQHQDFHSNSG